MGWQGEQGSTLCLEAYCGRLSGSAVNLLVTLGLIRQNRFPQMTPVPPDAAGKQVALQVSKRVLDLALRLRMGGRRSDGLNAVVSTESEEAGVPDELAVPVAQDHALGVVDEDEASASAEV